MTQLFEVVESMQGHGAEFQILSYKASKNHPLSKSNQQIKQVRIKLNEGKIISEVDTFYFLRGQVEIDHKMKTTNSKMRKLASSMVKNEGMLKPTYTGTGEVYLKPRPFHYMIYRLYQEDIVIDPDLFVCAEASIEISTTQNKNLPITAAKHVDQFVQTKLSGTGIVVLKIPVPADELLPIELQEDRFQADQNIVILRSGAIDFTVENASKSLLSSFTNADAFLRTYTGTGTLWLAPTQLIDNEAQTKE